MKTLERFIVHSDINHCFAQIEEMKHPHLKDLPMCVGGSADERNGIVLARNLKAKAYGVATAETLVSARKKCPNLVVVRPVYEDYLYYSNKVKDIYREYTDKVESFGIDEAWFDLTHSSRLFGDLMVLAKTIQTRVLDEIGLTVSMGISWNKIFAKLGSDMVKPSGFTHISKENYKTLAWSLDVSDLLYVGPSTHKKLMSMGIFTIGDLAKKDPNEIEKRLGKQGPLIWNFANGLDKSHVDGIDHFVPAKSVGNSITTRKDIVSRQDCLIVYRRLVESVSARLRENNQAGYVVSISLRDVTLKIITRQKKLLDPLDVSDEILKVVMELVDKNYDFTIPLRSIGVSLSSLVESSRSETYQLNLFEDNESYMDNRVIDRTIDHLRDRFGFSSVKRCSVLLDPELTEMNPREEHVIFPPGNFNRR